MKECTAETNEHKCINCISYHRHQRGEKISEDHTALNKNCPSLQAVLTKYRKNRLLAWTTYVLITIWEHIDRNRNKLDAFK